MKFKVLKNGFAEEFDCPKGLDGLVCFDEKDGSEKCSGSESHLKFYRHCVKCPEYYNLEFKNAARGAHIA